MKDSIEHKIAKIVKEKGGRTYYVGGFVRDKLMGIENKDVDIEVHGISPETLYEILKSFGEALSFGKSFGIFSLKGYDIDIAMPRSERKTGLGHRDFEVQIDPFIGEEKAASRRDFTMNAIMQDVLTGEIVDPFGGQKDISLGVIRHVSDDSFAEDPLRVLRGAQFAARFGFSFAEETLEICRNIDLSFLSRERVEEELKKALLKGKKPSLFFETLRAEDQLRTWFSEVEKCIGIEQDPVYHPEGDVWVHTMEVLDRAAAFREDVSDPYSFMLLALCHDFGKIVTTEEINGRIHAYGHETEGLPLVSDFLNRIVGENDVREYVLNMVPLHMKPNMVAYSRSPVKSTNKMFDAAREPLDLIYFSMADRPLMVGEDPFSGNSEFLFERYRVYEEMMSRPFVQGRDLVAAGLEPGEYFSELLEYAHKLRLAGVDKKSALKQTLSYVKSIKK